MRCDALKQVATWHPIRADECSRARATVAPRETAPAAVRVRLWPSVCATLRTRRPQWPAVLSPTGKIGLCSSALVCDVMQRRAVLSYFGVLPEAVADAAAHVGFSGAQVDGSGAQLVEREHLIVCSATQWKEAKRQDTKIYHGLCTPLRRGTPC
jgi:hypothetical protein